MPPGKNSGGRDALEGFLMSKSRVLWKDWLVPPVLFPVSLVALIVVYALVRAPA